LLRPSLPYRTGSPDLDPNPAAVAVERIVGMVPPARAVIDDAHAGVDALLVPDLSAMRVDLNDGQVGGRKINCPKGWNNKQKNQPEE
jgi:hypothetical protein